MKMTWLALSLSFFVMFSSLSHATSMNDNCEYLPGTYVDIKHDDQDGSSVEIIATHYGYQMIVKIWDDGENFPDIVTNIYNCKDGHFMAQANGETIYYGKVDKTQLILTAFGSATYQRKI